MGKPLPFLLLPALAALTATLIAEAPAAAFCRSTTCTSDCPRDADGCKTTGEELAWPGLCVGLSLQRDGSVNLPLDEIRASLDAAAFAWTDVACAGGGAASIAFSILDDVSCHAIEYNPDGPNANVILFQDTRWHYNGPGDTLAKTTVTFDVDTGAILDADIEVNHAYNEFTTGDTDVVYDLPSVLTHELGHLLGLDHSPDALATMNAQYELGTTDLRSLEPDDLAAACAAYPPDRPGACDPTPKGGLADACVGGAESGCAVTANPPSHEGALGAMMAALLCMAARRRRCRVRDEETR